MLVDKVFPVGQGRRGGERGIGPIFAFGLGAQVPVVLPEYAFRATTTYSSVAAAFAKKTGRTPPYAMLPQIRLKSPKIRSRMTTEIFARAVMARYDRCMRAK